MQSENMGQIRKDFLLLQGLTCFFAGSFFLKGYSLKSSGVNPILPLPDGVYWGLAVAFIVLSFVLAGSAFVRRLLPLGEYILLYLWFPLYVSLIGAFLLSWLSSLAESPNAPVFHYILYVSGFAWFSILCAHFIGTAWRQRRVFHEHGGARGGSNRISRSKRFIKKHLGDDPALRPLREWVTWLIMALELAILVYFFVYLLGRFGSTTGWVWLIICGILSFEWGALHGWCTVGVYLRAAWHEEQRNGKNGLSNRYRALAGHDAMPQAATFFAVGIGFFTLAMILAQASGWQ